VLDLRYEARDIDQNLTSQEKVDQWFDSRTHGLTDTAKAQLRQRWSTMQNVLSSRERLGKIVADIVLDKDLFGALERAITDYTGEAFENFDAEDVQGLLKDSLQKGRKRLEETREAVRALCEPVEIPRDTAAYIRYFCGTESGNAKQLKANEQKRINLYKWTAAFVRAYANLANEMHTAGVTEAEEREIKTEVTHYENVRQEIKLASGDYVDLKVYEPDMRHLLDTYIRAEEGETISIFDDIPLVQLLVDKGNAAIEKLPEGIRTDKALIAATIENNIRRLIVDKSDINPKYYEDMSKLLEVLISKRKRDAIDYQNYLSEIADLSGEINDPETRSYYPSRIDTGPLRALFDNLRDLPVDRRAEMALAIDIAILDARMDDWRGNQFKERKVRIAIEQVIETEFSDDDLDVDAIFELVKNQDGY